MNNVEELKEKLKDSDIDLSQWGKNTNKSAEDLLEEIKSGESILKMDEGNRLVRRIFVCTANIYYKDKNSKTYILKEEKQIFKNGKIRKRNLSTSMSEKMNLGENPLQAITRGIQEELGTCNKIDIRRKGRRSKKRKSISYPGILTEYIYYDFEAFLNEKQFKKEGYEEKQNKKTTKFIWEELKT